MLAALLLLMRSRRDRWLPLAFAAAGVLVVGLYVVVHMADGSGTSLFFGGRLRDPLGYVNGQGLFPARVLARGRARRAEPQQAAGRPGAASAVVLGAL